MKLYANAEFLWQISDNAIYDEDGDIVFEIHDTALYNVETIAETDDTLVVEFYFDGKNEAHIVFCKTTGFLLMLQMIIEETVGVAKYDEKTGLEKKTSYYTDGRLNFYEQYEYEKDKVTKILYCNADDSLNGYIQFAYDKRTGAKIKESEFDVDNHLVQTIEYDSISEKQIKKSEYNDNGSLRTQTIYEKISGNAIERLVYEANVKKSAKWTFIPFDDDEKYALNKDFYLNTDFCQYSKLKQYSEEST